MLADLHRFREANATFITKRAYQSNRVGVGPDLVCVVSPRRQFAGALRMLIHGSLPMRLGNATEPYVVSV
jgi:hypothetical protein